MQELERINSWMTMSESHKYCNTFSLIVISRGSDDGHLCDSNGESFSTVQSLTDKISKIPTLFNKPKFLLFQSYVPGKLFFYYFSFNKSLSGKCIYSKDNHHFLMQMCSLLTDTDYGTVILPDLSKRKDLSLVYDIKYENT